MFQLSKIQLISSTLLSLFVTSMLSTPIMAATDQQIIASTDSGLHYLAANQNAAGMIVGFEGDTDWSVIAVQAKGQSAATFRNGSGASAIDFLATDVAGPTTPATSIERKIIALASAGQDTNQFGGINYLDKLKSYHTGNQIGDPNLLNDDIFGVIAIDAAHDSSLKAMAQDGLNYILSHQLPDGGFSYTTSTCDLYCGSDSNDTAAAIIALEAAADMSLTHADFAAAKDKAVAYLSSLQQPDGGFGYDSLSPSDGSSTAWGLMALNALGGSPQTKTNAARDWLLANQNPDGGFSYGAFGITTSSPSTTAHAIVALLGSNWLLRPTPLRPTPLQPAAATPPLTPSTNAPHKITSSATSRALPVAPAKVVASTPPGPVASAGSVQGVSQAPAQSATLETKSSPNYALYGVLALAIIAMAWFILQSIRKKRV